MNTMKSVILTKEHFGMYNTTQLLKLYYSSLFSARLQLAFEPSFGQ